MLFNKGGVQEDKGRIVCFYTTNFFDHSLHALVVGETEKDKKVVELKKKKGFTLEGTFLLRCHNIISFSISCPCKESERERTRKFLFPL